MAFFREWRIAFNKYIIPMAAAKYSKLNTKANSVLFILSKAIPYGLNSL